MRVWQYSECSSRKGLLLPQYNRERSRQTYTVQYIRRGRNISKMAREEERRRQHVFLLLRYFRSKRDA